MKIPKKIENIHALFVLFEKKVTTLFTAVRAYFQALSRGRLAGAGAFMLAAALAVALLISNQSTLIPNNQTRRLAETSAVATDTMVTPAPIQFRDGIPITQVRDAPVDSVGLSINPEVVLTNKLAEVANAFNDYLKAHGEFAIVTSGYRSPETQLDIIKERIDERNANARFPKLDDASVADVNVWLRAWRWLARRHVPVNAPEAVGGANVSMHTKGRAMDFISDDLDHLRSMFANFERSKYSKDAPMHITAIVREPGCVHINLG